MGKGTVLRVVLFMVIFYAVWIILDYLWSRSLSMQDFHFTTFGDVVQPLCIGIVMAYVLIIRKELKK